MTLITVHVGAFEYKDGTLALSGPGQTSMQSPPQYFYYTKDHLGNIRSVVTKNLSTNAVTEVQRTHYYPYGGIIADISTGRNVQPRLYNGKELDRTNNLFWYDFVARPYDPTRGQFTGPDQKAEEYYPWNQYAFCGNNPMNRIDPDGREWFYYSVDGKSEATWNWHDGHEYNTGVKDANGNDIILQGVEAVVIFNGYTNERLGDTQNMMDKNAFLADVKVLGPRGSDDISYYKGYTMTSNQSRYGVVKDGDYVVSHLGKGERPGPYNSMFAVNNRGKVPEWTDYNPRFPKRDPAYLEGVFIHRPNWNGFAGEYYKNGRMHGVSEGCLLIHPKDWSSFNNQLSLTKSFILQLKRK